MKITTPEILKLSALELSRRLHSRQITATQLLEITLTHVDNVNPFINAIVGIPNKDEKHNPANKKFRERLYQEASLADDELDRIASLGNSANAAFSSTNEKWLLGIPIAVKDLANALGFPTTNGGSPLSGMPVEGDNVEGGDIIPENFVTIGEFNFEVQAHDDPFVGRLREAGAIIIGKTNAPELGMGCHTYNPIHGTTINPITAAENLSGGCRKLSAGGSSGGAAAAVSSHMLCVADGSDMMGSLRNPAGWNGLYSLRPTAGWMEEELNKDGDEDGDARHLLDNGARIHYVNADENKEIAMPYPISTVGPMARTPFDVAMLLHTLLPESTKQNNKFDAFSIIHQSNEERYEFIQNIKIGWLGNWGGAYSTQDGIQSRCRSALENTFGCNDTTGHPIVECIKSPPFSAKKLWDAWMVIRSNHIYNSIRESVGIDKCTNEILNILQQAGVKDEAIFEYKLGASVSSFGLVDAVKSVHAWSHCANELFQLYDVLALPSSQVYPFDASLDWPKFIDGKKMDTYHRWMEVMVPVTLLGAPCVTIPVGFSGDDVNLPMGVQLFGPRGEDEKLLKLACWYYRHIARR